MANFQGRSGRSGGRGRLPRGQTGSGWDMDYEGAASCPLSSCYGGTPGDSAGPLHDPAPVTQGNDGTGAPPRKWTHVMFVEPAVDAALAKSLRDLPGIMRAQFGVRVLRGRRCGTAPPRVEVMMLGPPAGLSAATGFLGSLDCIEARVPVEPSAVPWIVGRCGRAIRKIEHDFGVAAELPAFAASAVALRGLREDVLRAAEHVRRLGAMHTSREVRWALGPSQVQHLLRDGCTALDAIQSRVGAGVKVDLGGDCCHEIPGGHPRRPSRAGHTLASTGRCPCGAEVTHLSLSGIAWRVSAARVVVQDALETAATTATTTMAMTTAGLSRPVVGRGSSESTGIHFAATSTAGPLLEAAPVPAVPRPDPASRDMEPVQAPAELEAALVPAVPRPDPASRHMEQAQALAPVWQGGLVPKNRLPRSSGSNSPDAAAMVPADLREAGGVVRALPSLAGEERGHHDGDGLFEDLSTHLAVGAIVSWLFVLLIYSFIE